MQQPVDKITCPACSAECKLCFNIADTAKTDWVFCKCGTIFQTDKTDKKNFDIEYIKKYTDYKALPERADYLRRLYLPLVRELTYGRHFLDVGCSFDHHVRALAEDGWIAEGMDLVEGFDIKGDFETYDFKNKRYDFILMGRVLESMHNPLRALLKAKELLAEEGVILIVTPDAELVYQKGMFEYGNWDPRDKWVMFSESQLKKILETLGFKVIMSRKDVEHRCIGWNHAHLIAQKVS